MPTHEQAAALLDQARALQDGIEALDVSERAGLLIDVKRIRAALEAVKRRGESEEAARARGLGAPARFRRLR